MPPTVPAFLRPALARPVAIFGAARSGRGVAALLGRIGASAQVYDERAGDGRRSFGAAEARGHGLAVFSPGFPPEHPWLAAARAAGALCLGELDFASLFWRGRVIAVTGTNGKTTLTEFVAHALRRAGGDAAATGNIGHPFSQLAAERDGGAPGSVAVCEVSSFQAETLRHFHAETVLWTNFAEDHLERHPGLEAYFRAKAVLAGRADAVFAGSSVRAYRERFGGDPAAFARAIWVPTEAQPADPRLAATVFADYPQRENFLLAAAWWRAGGRAEAALLEAARSFRLGRHRLERVGEVDGVAYWNDSKATNFHAVEAALSRFARPVLLIAGGKSKGGDLAGFVRRIAPRVRQAFFIGETRRALADLAGAAGLAGAVCSGLAEAVRLAAAAARPGEDVLLSPGFASFDQFHSYEDRGDQFVQRVGELAAARSLHAAPA